MVEIKFEKRLRAEIVPEWRTKYIDYKGLKKRLRHIGQEKSAREKEFAQSNYGFSRAHSPDLESSSIQINHKRHSDQSHLSQERTFSLASSFFHKVASALVSVQNQQSLHAPPPQIKSLDTLMDQIEPEERLFFAALDKELAKIESFCELKEKEASSRMNVLIQQNELLKEEKQKQHPRRDRNTKTFVRQSFEYIKFSTERTEKYTPGFQENQEIEYKTAKKLIKKAVFEFYRSVELLRNYCVLNYTGFVKILKKYDRVSERNGYKIYIKKVSNGYTPKFKAVKNLVKEVEDFYVANFESGSRSRALRKLRTPNKQHKTYYSSVLRVGLCLGLAIPAIPIAINSLLNDDRWNDWVEMLQFYGGLVLPILMLLLTGVNMYFWTKLHINYKFIFELDPRNNLDFRQFFELPAVILLAICYTMLISFQSSSFISPTIYVILFTIFVGAIVFNPFPIFYYNARKWFIFSVGRLLGSGILRVEFRDFFIADVLTSLSYSLTMLEFFGRNVNAVKYNVSTATITPFLGSIPASFRLFQCLKRYRDTHQVHHLINLFKYLSIILAIFMASLYNKENYNRKNLNYDSNFYYVIFCLWLFAQSFASLYTFSWDVKMDWSLFRLDSVNFLLRDELGYEHRWIYYAAIVTNFFLRWSWIFAAIFQSRPIVGFSIAFGELLRRWIWNFFRVENEHINNVEQNRAVKDIPLPFQTEEIIIPEFDTAMPDIESDFDRISFASWKKRLFASNPRSVASAADSIRDFEPRNNAPQYMYDDIYEESDEESDGGDGGDGEEENYANRSKRLSVVRTRGDHGLSNTYASRSFLPVVEDNY